MATLARLGFGLLSYISACLKGSISNGENDGKEPNPHQYFHKCSSGKTWKSKAIGILKHYFNDSFLQKLRSCARFPYQEENVGNWFTKEIPLPQDLYHVRTINILNLTGRRPGNIGESPAIMDADFSQRPIEDGFTFLFHGTKHESAQDIIENGIRLDKLDSRRYQDFSCGNGFYLTKSFEEDPGAVHWAFHRHNNKQAVLIFKIPNDVFDRYRADAESFFHNNEELKTFVEKFRIPGKTRKRELEKILEEVSFVEGPHVKIQNNRFVSSYEGSYQICLHSEELANSFDRHLDSAIFFNKR